MSVLFDELEGQPDMSDEWRAKVAKCRSRTTQYMAHLLRCCVQQFHIAKLIASVATRAGHVHVCFDYKVRCLALLSCGT